MIVKIIRLISNKIKFCLVKFKDWFLVAILIYYLFDIFYFTSTEDSWVLVIIVFWVLISEINKIRANFTLMLGLISIIIAWSAQFFQNDLISEKGASWFFIFVIIFLIKEVINKLKFNE